MNVINWSGGVSGQQTTRLPKQIFHKHSTKNQDKVGVVRAFIGRILCLRLHWETIRSPVQEHDLMSSLSVKGTMGK